MKAGDTIYYAELDEWEDSMGEPDIEPYSAKAEILSIIDETVIIDCGDGLRLSVPPEKVFKSQTQAVNFLREQYEKAANELQNELDKKKRNLDHYLRLSLKALTN